MRFPFVVMWFSYYFSWSCGHFGPLSIGRPLGVFAGPGHSKETDPLQGAASHQSPPPPSHSGEASRVDGEEPSIFLGFGYRSTGSGRGVVRTAGGIEQRGVVHLDPAKEMRFEFQKRLLPESTTSTLTLENAHDKNVAFKISLPNNDAYIVDSFVFIIL